MCPLCLTTLAVTVASTTGAGATVAALALKVTRAVRKSRPVTDAQKGPTRTPRPCPG